MLNSYIIVSYGKTLETGANGNGGNLFICTAIYMTIARLVQSEIFDCDSKAQNKK